MLPLYLFLFIVGGGIALLSMAGDILGGGADLDFDPDLDLDVDAGSGPGLDGSSIWKAFSLMGLVYGIMGAGATGTLLHLLWDGDQVLVTGLLAAGAGVVSGAGASLILGYLKSSGSGDVASERSFEGLAAQVLLPIQGEVPGQIRIRKGAREHVLRALPFGSASQAGPQPATWTHVVVVEVRDGVAYVTPGGPALDSLNP